MPAGVRAVRHDRLRQLDVLLARPQGGEWWAGAVGGAAGVVCERRGLYVDQKNPFILLFYFNFPFYKLSLNIQMLSLAACTCLP